VVREPSLGSDGHLGQLSEDGRGSALADQLLAGLGDLVGLPFGNHLFGERLEHGPGGDLAMAPRAADRQAGSTPSVWAYAPSWLGAVYQRERCMSPISAT